MSQGIKCLKCSSTDYETTDISYNHAEKTFLWYKCKKCKAEYSHLEESWNCSTCKTQLTIAVGKQYHIKNTAHEIGYCSKCQKESYRPITPISSDIDTDLSNNFHGLEDVKPEISETPDKLFMQRIQLNT